MNNGMVVKIKSSYVIVLTQDQVYVKLQKKNHMCIGQKLVFLEEDVIKPIIQKEMKVMMKKRFIALATVACLLLIIVIRTNSMPTTTYALVSIDINPSIDLKIDEDKNVVEIIPLNEEAKLIYDEEMIGKVVFEVIEEIIENAKIEKFLTDDNNNILISSAVLEGKELVDLGELMDEYLRNDMKVPSNVRVIYIESNQETAEESLESGISLGRLELTKITKDEASKEKPISEFFADEAVDLELAENIVIAAVKEEDSKDKEFSDEDLKDLNEFLDKLSFVPEMEEFVKETKGAMEGATVEELEQLKMTAKAYFFKYKDENKERWDGEEYHVDTLEDVLKKLVKLEDKFGSVEDVTLFITSINEELSKENPDYKVLKEKIEAYIEILEEVFEKEEEKEDATKDIVKELDKLKVKYGEVDGVDTFITSMKKALEKAEPDYEAIEEEVEDYIENLEEILEKEKEKAEVTKDIIKELDKLKVKYREQGDVDTFITSMKKALEKAEPNYEAIKEEIEDYIENLEETLEKEDATKDIVKELDKLKVKHGEVDGVDTFIASIKKALEETEQNYEAIEDEIEDYVENLEETLEKEEEKEDATKDIVKELDKLKVKHGEVDGVDTFIASMKKALEEAEPDYGAIEEEIEDYIENLEEELEEREKENGKEKDEEDLKDLLKELDKLEEKYGEIDGVASFITSIKIALEGEPDYEAIEAQIEAYIEAVEAVLEEDDD